ncbi:phosphohistidine phosphatase [Aliiruegeria haliotis]|uniref:Phosphohistidine phosphatase n=1 Tax=Aliiruegeria haliotis TaxID=1280846 RepID=A0A2T0RIY9_9RHOB|nr:histidine phosphatase family protein [Aliiruegeria haliotis]PRY21145.1 phosphohistidine phosphatase [Aliiruegeria haliotis]
MKTLILLRHAKSNWVNPDLEDIDRPLNKRGKRSAKALGKWVRKSPWTPDKVLCSTSRRTRETWEGLSLEGTPELRDDLYHASPDAMLDVIRKTEGDVVMLIAHNPGIAALAHELVAEAPSHSRFSDYPTGSLLVVEFDVKKLGKIALGSGSVRAFLTPHDLVDQK